ncbi:hypothetical protein Taro_006351 [Colocasia esculenta]|uniref:Uncharacterized protein n=1 Tax=Colocasia esculenta TaxID=4460 RepID=A0A843TVR0_COLES|nr:hypothetical protein [Colocasia esculenta]
MDTAWTSTLATERYTSQPVSPCLAPPVGVRRGLRTTTTAVVWPDYGPMLDPFKWFWNHVE